MKAQLLTAFAVFIVVVILTIVIQIVMPENIAPQENVTRLKVGEAEFAVETADTEDEQAKGLSGREDLPRDHGLLFRFLAPSRYTFWMKDMHFPLDFVWIREGRVVGVTENAIPEVEDPPRKIYSPPEAVDMVLEVNAGVVAQEGIAVGNPVELLP